MHELKLALQTSHADGRYHPRRADNFSSGTVGWRDGPARRSWITRFFMTMIPRQASGSAGFGGRAAGHYRGAERAGICPMPGGLRQPPMPRCSRMPQRREPEAIRLARERPDDFDAFWQARLAELAKRRRKPASRRLPAIISCFTTSGLNAPARRWPTQALRAGGQTAGIHPFSGRGVKSAYPDVPLIWASRGCLALCINAHGLPNGQPAEFYQDSGGGRRRITGSMG